MWAGTAARIMSMSNKNYVASLLLIAAAWGGYRHFHAPEPAAMTPIAIAGTRPIRSATSDHGMTAVANPRVEADTVEAAPAGPDATSTAIAGSTACVA